MYALGHLLVDLSGDPDPKGMVNLHDGATAIHIYQPPHAEPA